LANIKSQVKRNRQNEKRRQQNRIYRGSSRTYIKKALVAIEAGDKTAAEEAVKTAIQGLDRSAQKGVLHKNNAARRKSRLMAKFNAME
jgi:small subunit ribosomal protein S20